MQKIESSSKQYPGFVPNRRKLPVSEQYPEFVPNNRRKPPVGGSSRARVMESRTERDRSLKNSIVPVANPHSQTRSPSNREAFPKYGSLDNRSIHVEKKDKKSLWQRFTQWIHGKFNPSEDDEDEGDNKITMTPRTSSSSSTAAESSSASAGGSAPAASKTVSSDDDEKTKSTASSSSSSSSSYMLETETPSDYYSTDPTPSTRSFSLFNEDETDFSVMPGNVHPRDVFNSRSDSSTARPTEFDVPYYLPRDPMPVTKRQELDEYDWMPGGVYLYAPAPAAAAAPAEEVEHNNYGYH